MTKDRNGCPHVKKDLIDEAQESTNCIIEEKIPAPCSSESVEHIWFQRLVKNVLPFQMFEEKWDVFDNHSETSSDSEERTVTHLLMSILNLSHCDNYISVES